MTNKNSQLIYLVTENARITLKELSKQLKQTPQRTKYTMSLLKKENIIQNPYTIFDYSYFSQILFRVYFKGVYIKETEKARIIKELKENPYVLSIHELSGEYDLAVEFSSPNPSKFNKEFKKLTSSNPKLNDYKIILNVVTHVYPRHYMVNVNKETLESEKIIGGDREKEEFTNNEMSIMKELLKKPTSRYSELSETTGFNVKTIKSTINNLTKRNIIKGYKYTIDNNALNVSKSRLLLKLHNLNLERETELMNYMLKTREIIQVNKTIGDWDLEISLETFDRARLRYIMIELKEEYKDIIEKFNTIEIYATYKISYLPEYIFEQGK